MADRVLVTGGTGYIAGWCIARLLERGYDVRTTVRDASLADLVRSTANLDVGDARFEVVVADLNHDAGWSEATAECRFVLHVASPLGAANPDDLIGPARDGTLRVLRAAVDAGVERVVMTSACAAAQPDDLRAAAVTDETIWTDPNGPNMTPYRRSKALAERAAWDFMADQPGTAFTTVLPGAVFGPLLAGTVGSVRVIARLLRGDMRGLPMVGFQVVDVRDLADLHLLAMTEEAAAEERFIAAGDFMTMPDIADVLRSQLGDAATKVPTVVLPDDAVRAVAEASAELRGLLPSLGRRHSHSAEKARRLLGWSTRPGADTVVDCARSLLAFGVID